MSTPEITVAAVTETDGRFLVVEERIGTHWLSRAELKRREPQLRSPLVLRCIDDYLGGRRQPLVTAAALDLGSALAVAAVGV